MMSSCLKLQTETSQERLSVGCRRVKQIQECQFLFCGKERRFEGISGQFPQMLIGKAKQLLCQLVLPRQRCTEHCGIVGVESNHDPLIEVLARRMSTQRRASASAKIAGETNLQRNLPGR